ncbi:hypothetical protein COCNU_02G009250 [Cocos nucifera]|uniref:Uncharacterized protein n=1 Tax=Cocos nucifera TaxID=13894 RepID=A0A8K0HZY4_COCNU|nr:hypothetical protein COCNU_02G009250 [Cocos nucifera]
MAQAIEEFKVSFEMRNLNVKFSQEAFIKEFMLCENRIASKFFKLDLGFLVEGAPDEEVGPSTTTTDLPPIEPATKEPKLTDATSNSSTTPLEV